MQLNFALQFEFGDAAQVLPQNFSFYFELVVVVGVLVMASATAGVIGTWRLNAVRRRFDDCDCARAREARLFFGERSFDFFPGKNEGNKGGLAAAVVSIIWRNGGKASEAVAAIDQFFDCEEQELILRHGEA